jgi:biotin carboxyl carrier protein
MSPSTPSFTPAAGPGPAGPPSAPAVPGVSPAGNGRESRDEPAQGLPVRNGNGSGVVPASRTAVGEDADQAGQEAPPGQETPPGQGTPAGQGTLAGPGAPADPGTPAGPAGPAVPAGPGPSKLPAFGGPARRAPQIPQSPIGGQNVHGGDGPSAADAATVANGGQGTDSAADPGKVAVPTPAAEDLRLPIFDSLESDWFRRSGKTLSTPQVQATPAAQPAAQSNAQPAAQPVAQPAAQPVAQPAAQASWTSPADEGWRAAQALAAPAAGEVTQAGLPRRVPRANLVPGSVGSGAEAEADAPARSADVARSRMASFQRGVREGRAATPQIEEP